MKNNQLIAFGLLAAAALYYMNDSDQTDDYVETPPYAPELPPAVDLDTIKDPRTTKQVSGYPRLTPRTGYMML